MTNKSEEDLKEYKGVLDKRGKTYVSIYIDAQTVIKAKAKAKQERRALSNYVSGLIIKAMEED